MTENGFARQLEVVGEQLSALSEYVSGLPQESRSTKDLAQTVENLSTSFKDLQLLESNFNQQETTRLQQALKFEALLKRITDQVRESLDERQILQTAVQELALGLGVKTCDIGIYNADKTTCTIYYEYALTMPAWVGTTFNLFDSAVPEVHEITFRGESCQFCFNNYDVRVGSDSYAVLTCALTDNLGILGNIWLYRDKEEAFDELEVRLVEQVANQCTIALRQARLLQAAQAQVLQAEVARTELYQHVQQLNVELEHQVQDRTAQLQQALEFEALLKRITDKVRDSLDETQILQAAVRELALGLNVDCCDVATYDDHRISFTIRCEYTSTLPSLQGQTFLITDSPDPAIQEQLFQGLSSQFCFISNDGIRIRQGQYATLACPLIDNQRVLGNLWLFRDKDKAFNELEVRLAQQVANQCAIALRQARLYQASQAKVIEAEIVKTELYQQVQQLNVELERQVQERTAQLQQALEFEALLKRITDKVRDSLDENQILQTAVNELALGLGVDCCDTGLYDLAQGTSVICYEYTTPAIPSAQGTVIQIVSSYYGVYDQLLQGECIQFCEMAQSPVRPVGKRATVLVCPLMDDQGVLGDLWLLKLSHDAFNELEVRLVRQVANQCAIALRQARLYQAAQTQLLEKEVLLKEIHHRVKNNLQMVSSLLKLQASSIQDHNVLAHFKESQNRVRAMALIHEKLYQSDSLAKIYLPHYVRNLANDLLNSYRVGAPIIALNLEIADIELAVDTVIPCGLIINELVSNAIKYAFIDQLDCKITICFSALAPKQYQLTVQDNGIGLSANFDFQTTSTLGLQLVCSLTQQLQGTIELDRSSGTTFRITFTERARVD